MKFEPSGVKPREVTLVCPNCDDPVLMEVAGTVGVPEEFNGVAADSSLLLLQCESCLMPTLMSKSTPGASPERVWPAPERELSDAIPKELRDVHNEARICFRAKAYTAAAVMVRRTLEGVGQNLGTKPGSLISSLKELESRGLIEGRLLEWAQELRVLGNKAAHFAGGAINADDARDALELAEALLDYVYVFSAKFEQFKSRNLNASLADAN
ncbi:DUF4145 domain-containing protein [Dactylosporangium sp. NPDC048998]|uniref:DUF4145 domain-containing protein n=1 Tax=Dactylosporangium sp. NPDC048998 TaxID=3363976 RepID=UPI0037134E14